jgi:hypothetical protein
VAEAKIDYQNDASLKQWYVIADKLDKMLQQSKSISANDSP